MILAILVVVMALALVVETIYFNFKQVKRIDKEIKVRDEFVDLLFKIVKGNDERLDDTVEKLYKVSNALNTAMDVHDNLAQFVIDNLKKPTKEKAKAVKKEAGKKRGRPRKK